MTRLAIALGALILLLARCQAQDEATRGLTDSDEGANSVGSGSSASCLKQYSPESLHTQGFAFDGVVVAFQADSGDIEFKVNQWFKGSAKESVNVKAPVPLGEEVVSSADFPRIEKGERYLVSGEEGFAHACGFTRVHTQADAQIWQDTFLK